MIEGLVREQIEVDGLPVRESQRQGSAAVEDEAVRERGELRPERTLR
jgi:hypothetical protein